MGSNRIVGRDYVNRKARARVAPRCGVFRHEYHGGRRFVGIVAYMARPKLTLRTCVFEPTLRFGSWGACVRILAWGVLGSSGRLRSPPWRSSIQALIALVTGCAHVIVTFSCWFRGVVIALVCTHVNFSEFLELLGTRADSTYIVAISVLRVRYIGAMAYLRILPVAAVSIKITTVTCAPKKPRFASAFGDSSERHC